jgi:hypothetical protein
MFSLVHSLQLAFPRPPTPITAMLSFFDGEQLIRLGINAAPAVTAEAVLKKFLLEIKFMIKILVGISKTQK